MTNPVLLTPQVAPGISTTEDAKLLELVRSGRLHDALCWLTTAACPPASGDPCVVLANIAVGQDGSLTVDASGPRVIVPTNRLLLKLVQSIIPGRLKEKDMMWNSRLAISAGK